MSTIHEHTFVTRETHAANATLMNAAGGDRALLCRVRGEYREMPGMRLTVEQAMRLWGLDRSTVTGLFQTLVAGRFLETDGSGRYRMGHGGY